MPIDTAHEHGQAPDRRFSAKNNKVKAILSLHGILDGVSADQRLNDHELAFLDLWLKGDVSHIDDGDILDLRCLVSDVLKDGVVTADEKQDLEQLIQDILDYSEQDLSDISDFTNRLIGFLQGITADGVLNRQEILALKDFIDAAPELKERWPGDVISRRLSAILEDDVITEEEASVLHKLISKIAGQRFRETGIAQGMATQYFCDDPDDFNFEGAVVCFTGELLSGPRRQHERIAGELGAEVKRGVTKKTNCLIVGEVAGRDWKYSSHGRKIEAAAANNSKGTNTLIITENCWLRLSGQQAQ